MQKYQVYVDVKKLAEQSITDIILGIANKVRKELKMERFFDNNLKFQISQNNISFPADYNNETIDFLKYFKQKHLEIMKKINIPIKETLYSKEEIDNIEDLLYDYYYDENDQDTLILLKPLDNTGVKLKDIIDLLDIILKIKTEHDF